LPENYWSIFELINEAAGLDAAAINPGRFFNCSAFVTIASVLPPCLSGHFPVRAGEKS
jgi:hypothetical protein